MVVHQQSLRDRQVGRPLSAQRQSVVHVLITSRFSASLEKILNLNHASPETSIISHEPAAANGLIPQAAPILNADGDPIWKVLVFDNLGRDVISSVLRVNDLRAWGVTIHLYVGMRRPIRHAARLRYTAISVTDSASEGISTRRATRSQMFRLSTW